MVNGCGEWQDFANSPDCRASSLGMAKLQGLTEDMQELLEQEVLMMNFTYLYLSMRPTEILPSLEPSGLFTRSDVEEVQSRKSDTAKNAVILSILRRNLCPLERFCSILSKLPKQQSIADQLMRDHERMKSEPQLKLSPKLTPPPVKPISQFPGSGEFASLLQDLEEALDETAVRNMKLFLSSLVVVEEDGEEEVSAVRGSLECQSATNASEFFTAMAPSWNAIDTDLLETVVKASGSDAAMMTLQNFLDKRDLDTPLDTKLVRPLQPALEKFSSEDTTVDGGAMLTSRQQAAAVNAQLLVVTTNRDQLSIAEMHGIKAMIAHNLLLPKQSLVYVDSFTGSVTLMFWISKKVAKYIAALFLPLHRLRSLCSRGVLEVTIEDEYHLVLPPLQHIDLWWASRYGYPDRVSSVLETGVSVDITSPPQNGFRTALIYAAGGGECEVAELLLAMGADPNLQSRDGFTPLHAASQFGHPEVVSLLLRLHANPHLTTWKSSGLPPLSLASLYGQGGVVDILLEEGGVDVNQLSRVGGMTALMAAAQEGHSGIVVKLVRRGASVNVQYEEGFTPLHYASQFGHPEVVSLLLRLHANPHLTTWLGPGVTPLSLASLNGQGDVVDILLEEGGVDINQLSREGGETALMMAAEEGHRGIVERLVRRGASVNVKSEGGFTAMDYAIANGHSDVQQELGRHGAVSGSEKYTESDYKRLRRRLGDLLSRARERFKRMTSVSSSAMEGLGRVTSRKHKQTISSDYQPISVQGRHPVQDIRRPAYPHHHYDPKYPDICFIGDQCSTKVTSEGHTVSWEDIGITIRIPPGAVAEGDKIDLAARPCLTGPFILPDGCKPASPPYLITCTPSYEFEKDVAVSLEHYVCLKTEDARKKMVFLSARAQPVRRGGQYQYQLRVVKGSRAVFGVEERVGTLSFKHFCVLQVGTTGEVANYYYSVRLCRSEGSLTQQVTFAFFCVSLCQSAHIKNLHEYLRNQYPGLQFQDTVNEPVHLTCSEVTLDIPDNTPGWRIVPDRKPVKIRRAEIDFPMLVEDPEYAKTSGYPPKIRLKILHDGPCTQPFIVCELKVSGLDVEWEFTLPLQYTQPAPPAPIHPSAHPSDATSEQRQGSRTEGNLRSSKPSLVDLLTFPGKERMINIPQEIGTNYVPFGILLLKDDTGAVVDAIGLKHKDNVQMINLEVLREWVTGKGRQPVSWQTLIDVLYSIGLSTLASDIQDVKCT